MEMTEETKTTWLKGILPSFSQVMLIEHPISGAMIFLALVVADLQLAALALCGCLVANVTAHLLKVDQAQIESGLMGFSPVLIGIAAGTFVGGVAAWPITLIGSALCIFATLVINYLFGQQGLPGLTFPFILITWFFLLLSFSSRWITTSRIAQLPQAISSEGSLIFPDIFIKGVGEIFLLNNGISSLLILTAIFIANVRWGALTIGAIVLSLAGAYLLGGNLDTLSLGLYSYNSILTFLALDLFLVKQNSRVTSVLFLTGGVITVCLDFALPAVLGVFGLPVLTFSFVIAVWFILIVEKLLVRK
ncbi:urea transporter [Enterococcus pallens]|uniref:Urea transporter n=1 Tax=Enterococcus pallens ATCC BAA-351 TaxID=1158607 RepID=R2T268_9ENTE|nr:urea transporter [Enterococcus pallens]EOH94349.1 urea transporter [Enterococcus pallens ATCC BAA-351]EOU24228.1 urea transporter [Enterococcus pallens ATCC BAA-351]OJG81992.1 urea transporter [Enterococcus pallens]